MNEWVESENRPFGWFNEVEGKAYLEAIKRHPKGTIVELGTYLGRSLSFILAEAKKLECEVYAVDRWNWEKNPDPQIQSPPCDIALFRRNLDRMDHGQVIIIIGDSAEIARHFEPESVDIVMVDTTHRCSDTLREIDAWWPKLKKKGEMLFHDYGSRWQGWGEDALVQEAVDKRFGNPHALYGTLAVIVK